MRNTIILHALRVGALSTPNYCLIVSTLKDGKLPEDLAAHVGVKNILLVSCDCNKIKEIVE